MCEYSSGLRAPLSNLPAPQNARQVGRSVLYQAAPDETACDAATRTADPDSRWANQSATEKWAVANPPPARSPFLSQKTARDWPASDESGLKRALDTGETGPAREVLERSGKWSYSPLFGRHARLASTPIGWARDLHAWLGREGAFFDPSGWLQEEKKNWTKTNFEKESGHSRVWRRQSGAGPDIGLVDSSAGMVEPSPCLKGVSCGDVSGRGAPAGPPLTARVNQRTAQLQDICRRLCGKSASNAAKGSFVMGLKTTTSSRGRHSASTVSTWGHGNR
jgi:hypothetical protein